LLILDTDIASAFAKAGHFEMLIRLFEKVGITPMVYEELQTPLMHGYAYPDEIFNKAELVTISEEEQREYLKLKEEHSRLGKGEVECLVVCMNRGYLFSSFDKKAVSIAKEFGVNVITAGAILKGFLIKGIATKKEVLKVIQDIETSDNRSLEMEL
jgi:predicted nucleic acid-binding protein